MLQEIVDWHIGAFASDCLLDVEHDFSNAGVLMLSGLLPRAETPAVLLLNELLRNFHVYFLLLLNCIFFASPPG